MNPLLKIALSLVFAVTFANSLYAQMLRPEGRLTLISNTPVMTSDVVNTSTIYYTPYGGNNVQIYNGTAFVNYGIAQLTMTLNSSNQVAGHVYDLFLMYNSTSGVILAAGPAWSSSTSRGSGAGSTQLATYNGLYVNANPITLTNGAGTYGLTPAYDRQNETPALRDRGPSSPSASPIPAYEVTYVGSIYVTAPGETSVQFKPAAADGGANNVIGIWNAYNRVPISSLCRDSNTAWTYASISWEPLDGASSNTNFRVTYLDGLAQSFVKTRVTTIAYNATAGNGAGIGVSQDSTTNTPLVAAAYEQSSPGGTTEGPGAFAAEENFLPALGLHYLQAMQNSPNSTTATFGFNGGSTSLLFDGEY